MKEYLLVILALLLIASPAQGQSCNIVDGYQQCDIDILTGNGVLPAPALAPSGKGTIYFDFIDDKWKCSEDGGAYVDFCSAGVGGSSGNSVWTFEMDDDIVFIGTLTTDVAIGTSSPRASTILELSSTDEALLVTRLDDPDTNVNSPVNGMIGYDIIEDELQAYIAGAWVSLLGGGGGSCWEEDGNNDLMPVSGSCTDTFWEEDGNGDLQPKA